MMSDNASRADRVRVLRISPLACLAITLAACAGAEPAGVTSTPPAAPTASASAEQLAMDAYSGMWRAYAEAGATANPHDPDLARYASGRALATLRQGLTAIKDKRQVLKGEYGSAPAVTSASPTGQPTTIHISDCLDGTNFLTYTTTGALADDEPGGRRSTTATVSNLGTEGWKVTGFAIQEVGTC
ncbi:hypothetical protein EDC02_2239 [Micromonospora sp. Llam0]|uniref:hypothetical protein n=1 Tax=Micromonospora sp. Llam0 TaxID=2485143 RepID=UPI000FC3B199|nr:hypothetical protein [Micromonospora sp. Llam0]ROO60376.1 hypothetical protein EDC02_2239 [Micromonospora sp. Llam0]